MIDYADEHEEGYAWELTGMSQPMKLLTSSETNEWYTPPWLIELARQCMGSIDLDPASCALAQQTVQATHYCTPNYLTDSNIQAYSDDGLHCNWWGNVWLNPPYGRTKNQSNAGIWATKLEQEYEADRVTQATLLVNSAHGYEWYEKLWRKYPVLCLRDRIRFVNEQGKVGGQSKKAQTLIYFGRRWNTFRNTFTHLGRYIEPDEE